MALFRVNYVLLSATIILGLVTIVAAHEDESHTELSTHSPIQETGIIEETYFQHAQNTIWIFLHILTMSLAWILILPISVMLSISRSRHSKIAQLVFFACNGLGLGFGVIYNKNTSDLYPRNVHHKFGRFVALIVLVQTIIGMMPMIRERNDDHKRSHIPAAPASRGFPRHFNFPRSDSPRFSQDSGHGTESGSASRSTSYSEEGRVQIDFERVSLQDENYVKQRSRLSWVGFSSLRWSKAIHNTLRTLYNIIDRTILLLGFATLATGWITYGGLFRGREVFNGMAHFIKGGVFFWLGVFSLARWAGSFQDIGWAWNLRPASAGRRVPSAEFVESFLIFFYGVTNIFLEHLAAWGKAWTATDLEHISFTIMFIGGGMTGMLVESRSIHDILTNKSVTEQPDPQFPYEKPNEDAPHSQHTINPIPALIIIMLGRMMSSHHQESMVSTMLHAQWGNLLIGAGIARIGSYILLFLSPPRSTLPSRLPTELLASFGLMAGGLIFMASARDVVETIELHELDAMFVFTTTIGFVMLLMSWVLVVLAIKGWAMRKEHRRLAYETLAMSEIDAA